MQTHTSVFREIPSTLKCLINRKWVKSLLLSFCLKNYKTLVSLLSLSWLKLCSVLPSGLNDHLKKPNSLFSCAYSHTFLFFVFRQPKEQKLASCLHLVDVTVRLHLALPEKPSTNDYRSTQRHPAKTNNKLN